MQEGIISQCQSQENKCLQINIYSLLNIIQLDTKQLSSFSQFSVHFRAQISKYSL